MSPKQEAGGGQAAAAADGNPVSDALLHNNNTQKHQTGSGDPEEVDFDTMLSACGDWGRYQYWLFATMIPFALFFAFVLFVQMFVTATPQRHWCRVPELEHLEPEHRKNLSLPLRGDDFSRCSRYDVNWTELLTSGVPLAPEPTWGERPCDNGWQFDHSDIPYATITTELEWVCERNSYATIAQTVFFGGSVVGGVLFGWMADKYGRIPALVGSNMAGCLGGVLSIWAGNLWQFSACRFLVGVSYDNSFMMIYIIVLEYVGARYRTLVANMSIAIFFGLGCVSLPWIALWIANWKHLLLWTSLPMLIVLLAPILVPESGRWLLLRGRTDKMIKILKKIARVNGRTISDKLLQEFEESAARLKGSKQRQSGGGVKEILRRPLIRRMLLILIAVYMSSALVFDALVRLSETLGLDFFVTFTLTSATEMPSVTLLTFILDLFGRRKLGSLPLLIAAMFCGIAACVPPGIPAASMAIAARFCVNMAYNTAIQWGAELLPTGARAGGTGLVHIMGYVATAASPAIVYLENYVSRLPLVLCCLVACAGGLLAFLLPETMGEDLPQSYEDGERLVASAPGCLCFGKNNKVLTKEEGRELRVLAPLARPENWP